jgi:hypothetical protein
MIERLFQTYAEKARTGRLERPEAELPQTIKKQVEGVFHQAIRFGTIVGFNSKSAEVRFEIRGPGGSAISLVDRLAELPPAQVHDILVGPPRYRWTPNLNDRLGFLALSLALGLTPEARKEAKEIAPSIAALNGDGAPRIQAHFARYQEDLSNR